MARRIAKALFALAVIAGWGLFVARLVTCTDPGTPLVYQCVEVVPEEPSP
jgi:hypothetical protein